MLEYRITLPERYPDGSSGAAHISARQGYYVKATTIHHAVEVLLDGGDCHGRDVSAERVFDVQAPGGDLVRVTVLDFSKHTTRFSSTCLGRWH